MRKSYFLLASLLLPFVCQAAEKPNSYNLGGISFENTYISATDNIFANNADVTSLSLNGFGLEYIHGFGISKLPMFIEVGGKLTFTFNNQTQDITSTNTYKYATSMCRISIPVSYAYRFIFKDDIIITPYAGFDFRLNLSGKTKVTHKYFYKGNNIYTDSSYINDSENYSWFNKDEVNEISGVYNGSWSRVQIGWHIGGRFQYKKYFASLTYGTDMNSIFHYKKNILNSGIYANEHWFTGNFSLGIGYSF